MLPIIHLDHDHPYPPRITAFTKVFWDALREGRFLTTRGKRTGKLTFPPKPISPHDWEEPIAWTELSGRGTLYTYTTMHAVPAAFAAQAPYRVCVVDLEEGVRLATRLIGETEPVIDGPVELMAVRYRDYMSFAARCVGAAPMAPSGEKPKLTPNGDGQAG